MQTVTLTITGMHCDGCARTIDRVLRQQPGVREAVVTCEPPRARVLFEPGQVTAAALADRIRRAGYGVTEPDG